MKAINGTANSAQSTPGWMTATLMGTVLLGLARLVPAQAINIRGYVYEGSTNKALSGVKAELKSKALSTTTDAAGLFKISQTTGLRGDKTTDIGARIRIEGTRLSLNVPEGPVVHLSIQATDLNGRSFGFVNGLVAPGSYHYPLGAQLRTPGVYLVRTTLGAMGATHKIVLQGRRFSLQDVASTGAARTNAASWDTLILSKSGYTTVKIALAASTDSVPKTNMLASSSVPAEASLNAPVVGYATVSGNTTGGGAATPTTVKTCAELKTAAADKNARVILFSGTIKTTDCNGGSGLPIASNKTIMGADKKATIYGGLKVSGVTNVILRNFNMQGIYPNSGPDDAISVNDSKHVWVDHLNIWDAGDGNLDITNKSSYVTVSWCKFWYTDPKHGHRLNALIGSGGGDHPEDWGNLKVTFHHNWFADLVDQRMPRLMYGQAHVFNNYYTAKGNGYCVGVGSYGAALVESNYFKDVKDPHIFMYDVYCDIQVKNNVYDNTTGTKNSGRGGARVVTGQDFSVTALTSVPYKYTANPAADLPTLVSKYAGPQ